MSMRELLVIRHAVAQQRDSDRWPNDDERPLTGRGKRRFRQAARGMARALPVPDEVLSSPLVRTRQTARILSKQAGYPKARLLRQLSPSASTPDLMTALRKRSADRVAIVGHEPSLSKLLGHLLQGRASAAFVMKKGAVAWISLRGAEPRLLAYLPPRQLRSLT